MISLIVDIYKANGTSVTLEVCPVGDHHEQGRVERKIRQTKETIKRTVEGASLTALGWQTVFYFVSYSINNLPIARKVSFWTGASEDLDNCRTPNPPLPTPPVWW